MQQKRRKKVRKNRWIGNLEKGTAKHLDALDGGFIDPLEVPLYLQPLRLTRTTDAPRDGAR